MDLPKNYNLLSFTERRLVREEYERRQMGLCYYCNLPFYEDPPKDKKLNLNLFPPNFLNYPIHLHHDHNTGMTIGAVHAYCNGVLWQYHGE